MNNPQSFSPSGSCPGIPLDDQDLIFSAPWEAKAFAIVNHLATNDHYTWPEWTQYLADEIASTEQRASSPFSYYEQWVMACEKMLADKGLLNLEDINLKIDEIIAEREADHHH